MKGLVKKASRIFKKSSVAPALAESESEALPTPVLKKKTSFWRRKAKEKEAEEVFSAVPGEADVPPIPRLLRKQSAWSVRGAAVTAAAAAVVAGEVLPVLPVPKASLPPLPTTTTTTASIDPLASPYDTAGNPLPSPASAATPAPTPAPSPPRPTAAHADLLQASADARAAHPTYYPAYPPSSPRSSDQSDVHPALRRSADTHSTENTAPTAISPVTPTPTPTATAGGPAAAASPPPPPPPPPATTHRPAGPRAEIPIDPATGRIGWVVIGRVCRYRGEDRVGVLFRDEEGRLHFVEDI